MDIFAEWGAALNAFVRSTTRPLYYTTAPVGDVGLVELALYRKADPALPANTYFPGEAPALVDVPPDREEGLGKRRGLGHRHALGHRQRLHFRRRAEFRVAAAVRERADPIARLPHRDRGAARDHLARNLESGQVGRVRRDRVQSHALQHVGPIHARGGDLDEDFLGFWLGLGPLRRPQDLRAARLFDLDCSHEARILTQTRRRTMMAPFPMRLLPALLAVLVPASAHAAPLPGPSGHVDLALDVLGPAK